MDIIEHMFVYTIERQPSPARPSEVLRLAPKGASGRNGARLIRKAKLLFVEVLALTALSLALFGLGSKYLVSTSASQSLSHQLYTVQQGDTLWGISERFSRNADPRIMEYQLLQETGGTGSIVVGEVLRIS